MLVGTGKQRVIIIGILGKLVVIDLHHGIGDLVTEHGITALSHAGHCTTGNDKRK